MNLQLRASLKITSVKKRYLPDTNILIEYSPMYLNNKQINFVLTTIVTPAILNIEHNGGNNQGNAHWNDWNDR